MWSSAPDGVGVCPLVFEADCGEIDVFDLIDKSHVINGLCLAAWETDQLEVEIYQPEIMCTVGFERFPYKPFCALVPISDFNTKGLITASSQLARCRKYSVLWKVNPFSDPA